MQLNVQTSMLTNFARQRCRCGSQKQLQLKPQRRIIFYCALKCRQKPLAPLHTPGQALHCSAGRCCPQCLGASTSFSIFKTRLSCYTIQLDVIWAVSLMKLGDHPSIHKGLKRRHAETHALQPSPPLGVGMSRCLGVYGNKGGQINKQKAFLRHAGSHGK